MASWSTKRKYGFFLGFIALLALGAGVPSFLVFYKAPTCFDGKQNGGERGVDCGGACTRLCPADFSSPRVLWSHSIRVVPGVYNSMAYVENPNRTVEAKSLPYVFRLYDAEGILVAERKGSSYVPAGQKFAVFEGGISTGERVPTKTTFEFAGVPDWRQGGALSSIKVTGVELDQTSSPKAEVKVRNESLERGFSQVTAFIILYDADGNRVSFSKTLIDSIGANESQTLYFTWPESFPREIVRKELLFVGKPR